jgi:hypothetical protein
MFTTTEKRAGDFVEKLTDYCLKEKNIVFALFLGRMQREKSKDLRRGDLF